MEEKKWRGRRMGTARGGGGERGWGGVYSVRSITQTRLYMPYSVAYIPTVVLVT